MSKTPHAISQEDLRLVASRAHGYVGADLSAVVREAGTMAIKRWLAASPSSSGPSSQATSQPMLTFSDLLTSLPSVRPSAMRSVFLETPPIRYADIGGQASVIQKLREAVEWPLLHPEAFARLGVKPPKGILLYGPPGCSKTVLARACAFESGVNFVAVKGPEVRFCHFSVEYSTELVSSALKQICWRVRKSSTRNLQESSCSLALYHILCKAVQSLLSFIFSQLMLCNIRTRLTPWLHHVQRQMEMGVVRTKAS